MLKKLVNDKAYNNLVVSQIEELLNFLVENDKNFAIIANKKVIEFTPQIPEEVNLSLTDFPMFLLSGYTFSTIELRNSAIHFEAGFGKDNFGSVVKVSFNSIFQIVVEEELIFINHIATSDNIKKEVDIKKHSIDIFKNNPKNKKFKELS